MKTENQKSGVCAASRDLSIVIPFHNEVENARFVLTEVRSVLPDAEIIAVDDASTDGTWECLCEMRDVRAMRLARQTGQSGAIYYGLLACTRSWCGLMDGDGQNDPVNFLAMLDEINLGETDVVCGRRVNRADSWKKKVASRSANWIRRIILKDGIHDTGCSQKIFPRTAVAALVPFRGLHRYLPAFFRSAGLRIKEIPVSHRPRMAGESKYDNLGRAVAGVYDLFGVRWLLCRRVPPPAMELSEAGPARDCTARAACDSR